MATKRASSKTALPPSHSPAASPVVTATLIATAVAYAIWLLVARGRMNWPPTELLSSAYTVAGCLALVSPFVLWRRDGGEGGLGELLWLAGGTLGWVFNLAALARGEFTAHNWATPMASTPMGLTILAVLLAGLRIRGAGRSWSWTNVTGWVLGVFWVALAVASLIPSGLSAGVRR